MPYVLIIRECNYSWASHDLMTTSHFSRDEAQADLIEYVRENWEAKMDEDPPEDEDELIDQYFEQVPEEYVITEGG